MKAKSEKIIIVAILILVFFFYKCPIKYIFGVSCPGCGMSRAIDSLLHLNFERAFYFHPLWPIVFIVILLVGIEVLNIYRFNEKIKKVFLLLICIIFIAAYIIRMVMNAEVIQVAFKESLIYHIYNMLLKIKGL